METAASSNEPQPSPRSLHGLDGLNFLMADVRDGLGLYLSIYLKDSQHWESGPTGIAMAASSAAAAVFQIPAGLLVDRLRAKRLLVAASGLGVAVGCRPGDPARGGAQDDLPRRAGRSAIARGAFCLTTSAAGVVAIQMLDGVAAGIFGVISILIAAGWGAPDGSTSRRGWWRWPSAWARG